MKRTTILVLAALALVGCGKFAHLLGATVGSGKIKSETRTVGAFHRIELGGSTHAEVRVGPKESLQLTADDNILPLIRSEVHDGVLVIDHRGSVSTSNGIKAIITVSSLDGVQISGAGEMKVEGVQAQKFEAELSGASDITMTGHADSITVELSGASKANLASFTASSANVDASGASKVVLNVSGQIKGSLSGASKLKYSGQPKVDVDSSGASSVSGS